MCAVNYENWLTVDKVMAVIMPVPNVLFGSNCTPNSTFVFGQIKGQKLHHQNQHCSTCSSNSSNAILVAKAFQLNPLSML